MLKILQESAACYIILTLMATSLAKMINWRASAIAVIREDVVPARIASVTVIFVTILELSLATFLFLGIARVLVSGAAVILFVSFGAYRLAVAVRTRSLMCACAGYARYNPATPPALASIIFTSISQATIASILFLPAAGHDAKNATVVRFIAWSLPFAVLIIGACARRTFHLNRFSLSRSFLMLRPKGSRGN